MRGATRRMHYYTSVIFKMHYGLLQMDTLQIFVFRTLINRRLSKIGISQVCSGIVFFLQYELSGISAFFPQTITVIVAFSIRVFAAILISTSMSLSKLNRYSESIYKFLPLFKLFSRSDLHSLCLTSVVTFLFYN